MDHISHEVLWPYSAFFSFPYALETDSRGVGQARTGFCQRVELLDPIPAEIVGAVRVKRLCQLAEANPWARPTLDLLSGRTLPVRRSPVGSVPHVRVLCPQYIPELVKIGLLERLKGKTNARCGLFTVAKRNGMARLIFDARPANCLLERHRTAFSTFHLHQLLGAWAEVGGVVSVLDYRHFYYQVPLAPSLRAFFAVEGPSDLWQPTVLAMGWQDAPVCAQVITWIVVLYREPQERGVVIEAVHDGQDLPQYGRVRDLWGVIVGYVWVLLDGVAVMGPRKELHEALMKRIRRNSELAGITIKEQTVGTFAGVTFAIRDGQHMWKAAMVLPVWSAPTTRRAVARQLGQLLWFLRVYEIDLLDKEAILRIFSRVGNATEAWDNLFYLSDAEQQTLRLEWKEWEVERWASRRTVATPTKWVWVATDATPTSTAALMFTTGPRVLCSVSHLDLGEDTQVQREMEAIAMGIGLVARGEGCIIATDAESCRVALEKGYSASARIRQCLRVIRECGVTVRTLRVAGTDNPADEISRGRELDVHKLQRLIPLFEAKMSSLRW